MIYELKNCSNVNRKPITYEIDDDTGCWECGSHFIYDGYPKCWYGSKSVRMHSAVFISHFNIINIPKNWVVRHTCDNRLCINPGHLLIGTNVDNMRDMVKRGRTVKGSKNGRSKLTEKEVLEIRNNITNDNIMLCKKYNVDRHTISDIKLKRSWGWLK